MVERETTVPARLGEALPANEYVVPEETRTPQGLRQRRDGIYYSVREDGGINFQEDGENKRWRNMNHTGLVPFGWIMFFFSDSSFEPPKEYVDFACALSYNENSYVFRRVPPNCE